MKKMHDYELAYIGKFLNDKMESFPFFDNKNYPKNSYILRFYLNGNLHEIKSENQINETTSWYSLKSFRVVVRTINKSVNFPNFFVRQAFRHCEDVMAARFKRIIN